MSWTGVRYITAVSVIGLTWLGPSAVEAQSSGLFSAVNRGAEQFDSPTPASLDATTVRRRVVTIDLGRLQRAQATVAGLRRPPVPVKGRIPAKRWSWRGARVGSNPDLESVRGRGVHRDRGVDGADVFRAAIRYQAGSLVTRWAR